MEHTQLEQLGQVVDTPPEAVAAMFELAALKEGELVCDPGCGSGQALVIAAQQFNAKGIGYEIRKEVLATTVLNIQNAGLSDQIQLFEQDFGTVDFQGVDVVFLYFNRTILGRLSFILEEKLKPGTRIVTYSFDLPGWSHTKCYDFQFPSGLAMPIYLYIA